MKATVIIPTLNAASLLPGLLEALEAQDMGGHEVMIIDSQSNDSTQAIAARSGARVTAVPRREFSHGGTRNRAALESSGEYLVFLTQDAIPVDERLLTNLLVPMARDRRIAVTYGRQRAHGDARAIEKLFRDLNYPEASCTRGRDDIPGLGVRTFFCSNACAAYRRETFMGLGMFRSRTIMNEDMEFVYRAVMSGFRVRYAADAEVWHSHSYSVLQQFRRYVDIGVFFQDNSELASLSKNEAEGRRYLAAAARRLAGTGDARSLAHLFMDSAARYAGYRVGSRYRSLPGKVMQYLSMNRGYWTSRS